MSRSYGVGASQSWVSGRARAFWLGGYSPEVGLLVVMGLWGCRVCRVFWVTRFELRVQTGLSLWSERVCTRYMISGPDWVCRV